MGGPRRTYACALLAGALLTVSGCGSDSEEGFGGGEEGDASADQGTVTIAAQDFTGNCQPLCLVVMKEAELLATEGHKLVVIVGYKRTFKKLQQCFKFGLIGCLWQETWRCALRTVLLRVLPFGECSPLTPPSPRNPLPCGSWWLTLRRRRYRGPLRNGGHGHC